MTKRTKSSARWLAEHAADPYVKRAHEEGWRSRAVFKLEEIQRTDRLLRPGMTVIDLGAAPGGWSQFAARTLAGKGRVIALDILEMPAIPGVEFIEGDFTDESVLETLTAMLGGAKVDLVMSDMAPNMMGIAEVDHDRSMYLVELAVDFAARAAAPRRRPAHEGIPGPGFPATDCAPAAGIRFREAAQAQGVEGPQRRGLRSGTRVPIRVVSFFVSALVRATPGAVTI